jgi:predicted aminopeptidase
MRGGARRPWRAVLAVIALLALSAQGCAAGYVMHAAYEEARLLWRREPVQQLLAGELDPDTRAKLELTLAVRRFAADQLGLNVGGSYESVATVEAGQIVYVVTAALRDRLQSYTWWFPIVGDVPYRAYFDPADATALADELQGEGYDTYVRPAAAFSTLGWFDDPLLSSLLRYDQERLAETIIHELLHNTIYVSGQTAFNESFATFTGHRGAELFFRDRGELQRATVAAARWADALTFSAYLGAAIARLDAAYAHGIDPEARTALFADIQRGAAQQQWLTAEYAGFAEQPLNNAVILHDQLYADRLGIFEGAYARNGDNLCATIAWIRQAVEGKDDPFAALQDAVAAAPGGSSTELRLDGVEAFDAVANGVGQHGDDDGDHAGERCEDARLGGSVQRHLREAAGEDRVHRPCLEHDHGADERHAEDHVDQSAGAGRHLGGVVGIEVRVGRADGERQRDDREHHPEQRAAR